MEFYKEINGQEILIVVNGFDLDCDYEGAYNEEGDEVDYDDIPADIIAEIEEELEERRQEEEDEDYNDSDWQEQESLERWIVGANY
jgi:hypothetical protein